MTEERKIKTSVYLDEDTFKQLKKRAIDERTSTTGLMTRLLQRYLAGDEKGIDNVHKADYPVYDPRLTDIPREFQKMLAAVYYILKENHRYAAPSLKKNIEAFAYLTQLEEHHAPPPDDPLQDTEEALRKLDSDTKAAKEHLSKHGGRRPNRSRAAG